VVGEGDGAADPLRALDDDDRQFVVRLVLAGGSLKELAAGYGVSYPTIRGRLDRLMGRLGAIVAGRPADPMADLLGELVEKGQIVPAAARGLLDLHRRLVAEATVAEKPPGDSDR